MDSLNYIWLCNSSYYDPDKFYSKSPIPAEYVNSAVHTAEKNPTAEVNIWVDFEEMRDQDISHLSDLAKAVPSNCSIRDLNEVPAFKEDPLLGNREKSIWERVDLLRLYVLDHVFKDEKVETAFYSDFDIVEDLSGKPIRERLAKTGCVFCYMGGPGTTRPARIENGFFGINKSRKSVLQELFIPSNKQYNGHDGWTAFWHSAQKICEGSLISDAVQNYGIWVPTSKKGRVQFWDMQQINCLREKSPVSCASQPKI